MKETIGLSTKEATSLFADSKNTKVAGISFNFASAFCLDSILEGKNPSNKNLSVGNPDKQRAVETDDAPGMAVILMLAFLGCVRLC
ncbi:MAG: hypothetical protein PQ612_10870 [Rickettsiales bacterium]|nr:hypothetical protein [Pseudomonadota bacterium]MDG4543406.1 hypothetical protein [Rickettsiales bacterium]MDG4546648.1 hypothetical protein [Rickettsiales bacterium]MDG4548121.1 hypothetical protein [Rickettsiales bacterium]